MAGLWLTQQKGFPFHCCVQWVSDTTSTVTLGHISAGEQEARAPAPVRHDRDPAIQDNNLCS